MRREIKDLIRAAEARGWASERTKGGHFKLTLRRGAYYLASTPSDHRAIKANGIEWQAAIKVKEADEAAAYIRRTCGVESRRDIEGNEHASDVFRAIEEGFFRVRRGIMPEGFAP